MKMVRTTPLMVTGSTLLAWADGDSTFDLFSEQPGVAVWAEETPHLRPAIVTTGRQLVWGFHYRPIWHRLASREFPVLGIGDGDLDDGSVPIAEALGCALAAENRTGEFQLSELDRVRTLLESRGAESSWGDIVDLLSVEADPWQMVERYRALPAVLADAVDRDLIDLRTAEAIPGDLAISAGRLIPLLSALSYSNRRQALRMAVELLRGGAVLEELVQEISRLSPKEVMPVLRRRRYPVLTELERRFDSVRRGALSGTGVTLAPPNNFEGDRFQISFTFRNGTELRSRLDATRRLEDNMDELLDLLF
jgi:hypothetical protein